MVKLQYIFILISLYITLERDQLRTFINEIRKFQCLEVIFCYVPFCNIDMVFISTVCACIMQFVYEVSDIVNTVLTINLQCFR